MGLHVPCFADCSIMQLVIWSMLTRSWLGLTEFLRVFCSCQFLDEHLLTGVSITSSAYTTFLGLFFAPQILSGIQLRGIDARLIMVVGAHAAQPLS
jgi:hypothetical protein